MQPGDLVSVYSIDYQDARDGRPTREDIDFVLGTLDGKVADSAYPPGSLAVVVDVKEMPHLVQGEEVVILLIDGKMGWAYKDECFLPDDCDPQEGMNANR